MPLNIDWQQILIHMFNVTILFAALYFILYKPVKDFMQKREDYYASLRDESDEILRSAKNTQSELEKQKANLEEELCAMKTKAEADAAKLAEDTIKAAQAEADKIIECAKNSAVREKEKILTDAKNDITELAINAAKKVVDQSTSDSYDTFLNSVEN